MNTCCVCGEVASVLIGAISAMSSHPLPENCRCYCHRHAPDTRPSIEAQTNLNIALGYRADAELQKQIAESYRLDCINAQRERDRERERADKAIHLLEKYINATWGYAKGKPHDFALVAAVTAEAHRFIDEQERQDIDKIKQFAATFRKWKDAEGET